ncbi:MAG: alkaline phosphatase family protein, partial [Candidatus Ornithospirochaeta sp.]
AIVLSIDAMDSSDIDYITTLPSFKKIPGHLSKVEEIECIYPSYTYPSHASISTGCYPNRHGIYHNEPFGPERTRTRWFWYEDEMKMPSIINRAKEHGLSTASVTWPVTGRSDGDWIIPEIWSDKGEDPDTAFIPSISPGAEEIYRRNRHFLISPSSPFFPDYFAMGCTKMILKEKKPDLMLLHISCLDTLKHTTGECPEKLGEAYDFLDTVFSDIIDSLETAGTLSDTTFFIIGDHGQKNTERTFGINRVLSDWGYIRSPSDWDIYAHSSSFSAEIYSKLSGTETRDVLERIRRTYPDSISRIMEERSAEEIYNLSGPFSFIVDSEWGTVFSESPQSPIFSINGSPDFKGPQATHGYAPERGPSTLLMAKGRRSTGKVIEKGRLVDIAPTVLSLFGIKTVGIDGKVMEGLVLPLPDRGL